MKSVIATAGLFAMANAYQPLNFHWRRQNDTYPVPAPAPVSSELPAAVSSEAPAGFTTLTVEVTEVATVTSCKPTVTNCAAVSNALPQSDLEVVVVTNTVVLTETVCPITEAESISSAVVKEHETGSLPGSTRTEPASTSALPTIPVPYPDVPLSTAPPAVTESAALPNPGEEYVTEVDDVETTATLTLTLGRGESATVVESVITTTFQTTVVKTVTACPGGCDGSGNGNGGDYPVPTGGSEGESEEDDFTTTTTATTTGTKTVTVQPPSKTDEDSSPEAPEASSPVGAEGGVPGTCSGSGEQCQCPSAVTVTIPASTVYVTIGGSQPTAVADNGSGNGNGNNGGSSDESEGNSPVEGEDTEEDDCPADEEDDEEEDDCPADEEDVDEDDCPADDEEDVVVVSQTVTVEPVPYPTGANNGTQPSGAPAPTGAPIYRRFSNAN